MVARSTSSMLQMDTVDSQKAMPICSAAWAACTSARVAYMPARPTGPSTRGMARDWPSTVVASCSSDTSRSTRWRRWIAARSSTLARSVDSS